MKRPSPRVGRGPAWSPGLVLAACLLATVIRPAAAQSGDALPVLPAPAVSAEAGLLVDLATGKVLYAKNAEGDRAPASLVKLMTLYIAYDDLRAGKVTLPMAREIVTFPDSRGCRRTSSVRRLNSGSSSRNNTP